MLYKSVPRTIAGFGDFEEAQQATLEDLKASLGEHDMVAIGPKVAHLIQALVEVTRDGCGVDGGDLQEWLHHAGILDEYEAIEPCCSDCFCASVTEFPATCYSDSKIYKELIALTKEEL